MTPPDTPSTRVEIEDEPARPQRGPGPVALLLLIAALALIAGGALTLRWSQAEYRPVGIVLHHSASDQIIDGHHVGAQVIDQWHAHRGWGRISGGRVYHIGYHYVITSEGKVQPGRPESMPGAHTQGHNDMLGICLVGNFEVQHPTAAQTKAAVRLVAQLMQRYGFKAKDVYGHRDLAQTLCPGKYVDVKEIARKAEVMARQGE